MTLNNVLLQLFLDNIDPVELAFMDFQTDFPHPNSPFGDPEFNMVNTTFRCPVNYRTVVRSIEDIDSACNTFHSDGVCQFTRTFGLVCQRSDTNEYIAGPGTFVVTSGNSADGQSYYQKFNESIECPVPGGKCVKELQAIPGYWGFFKSETSEEIEFVHCPDSTCCSDDSNCLSYDSCNGYRKGVMCSQCETNYTEALFTKHCVEDKQCDEAVAYSVVVSVCVSLFLPHRLSSCT